MNVDVVLVAASPHANTIIAGKITTVAEYAAALAVAKMPCRKPFMAAFHNCPALAPNIGNMKCQDIVSDGVKPAMKVR